MRSEPPDSLGGAALQGGGTEGVWEGHLLNSGERCWWPGAGWGRSADPVTGSAGRSDVGQETRGFEGEPKVWA